MADAEQLFADHEAQFAEAQRRAGQVRAGLDRVRVSERGVDGQVQVTVNATGNLVDLRLGNSLRERSGPEVAQEVLDVMRRAQSRLADAVREVLPEEVAGRETLDELMTQYHTAYPQPAPQVAPGRPATMRFPLEDAASAPKPVRRPTRSPGEDEDYSGRGVLR